MNVFNRVAMSSVLLLFIISILLVSLLPATVVRLLLIQLQAAQRDLLAMDPLLQLVGALLGLTVATAASALLIAELRPSARQSVVVAQVVGGVAEVTNESIALRVRKTVEAVVGVREAVPTIRSRGKAVDIGLMLITVPDVDVPKKTEEVMQAVRSEVETRMGIPIRSLRTTVKHAPQEARLSGLPPAVPPKPEPQR